MATTSKTGLRPIIYQLEADDLERIITRVVTDAMERYTSTSTPAPEAGLLTKKEVMERLHVTAMTLHRWDKSGYLRMTHIGRKVFYSGADIARIIKNK